MNSTLSQPSDLSTQPSPVRGWVVAQYANYRGKRLGPYYVRCWKHNGKIKKEYIKSADLEQVRAACQSNRERRQRGVQIAADFYNTVGNLNWLQRMAKRAEKAALRSEDYEHVQRIELHGFASPGRTKLRTKRSFMYPRSTNPFSFLTPRFLKSLKADVNRTFYSKFKDETIEEKWERWRREHAKLPPPRPLPKARVDLCVPLEHVDEIAAKLCVFMDRAIDADKPAPNWREM
jgi:hypothetical protein